MSEINFLPDSYLRNQSRQRRIYRQCTLVLLLIIALTGWWLAQYGRTEAVRRYALSLEAEVVAARNQMNELNKLRLEQQQLTHQLNIQRELAQPVSHTQIMAVLAQLLPPSVGLTDVTMAVDQPAPTAVASTHTSSKRKQSKQQTAPRKTPSFVRVDLVGLAPDDLAIANLVGDLSEHPLFEQVTLRYSRSIEFQNLMGREFRIMIAVPLDCQYEITASTEELAHAH
jgi:Tfp pilus assembly protein PilN